MRVVFYPNSQRWHGNPYLGLLQACLEKGGAKIEDADSDYLSGRWLIHHRKQVDVLHFHWIQYHYLQAPSVGSWRALAKFVAQVVFARMLGYRIVWTVHNVLPHERARGGIDVAARRAMALLAHAVLVLCEEGRRQVARRFGRRRNVYVTPHGHYVGVYPSESTYIETRTRLGLAQESTVYLFFGGVRPHKGVEKLLQAFAEVPGENVRLLIVGLAHTDEIYRRVMQLAATDSRVVTMLEFVSDSQLRCFIDAADVIVLPFDQVLSSSTVVTAMSLGCPVVAPALGCLPEWITTECGILYDPTDPDGLCQALLDCQECDLVAMGKAAYERALAFNWEQVAKGTLVAYRGEMCLQYRTILP